MSDFVTLLGARRLIPIATIEDAADAVPLAKALLGGGIDILEITLRTAQALRCIENVSKHVPQMLVGAGTILTTNALANARDAGAQFFVSPALSIDIINQAREHSLALMPGVFTPTEVLSAHESGCRLLKLFPADLAGGTVMLKHLASVYPQMRFCPTGGIGEAHIKQYLSLPNVAAIGGSWLAPASMIAAKNWDEIQMVAKKGAEQAAAM